MKTTYDPALRETEQGKRLYQHWRRAKRNLHSAEFDTFPDFYEWALEVGYDVGDRLILIDKDQPFSPWNCEFVMPQAKQKDWIDKWNKTVNCLRKQCGLPPLEG